tara:strand:- start:20 stop:217 length:198 start_codon:yes stop_codon:yes gene_type:complete
VNTTKSTETVQNILGRLQHEVSLEGAFNDSSPKSMRVKRQMVKVKKTFIELLGALDRLNDLKEID